MKRAGPPGSSIRSPAGRFAFARFLKILRYFLLRLAEIDGKEKKDWYILEAIEVILLACGKIIDGQ
jgi:hypothetical protein